jgi:hypothetical protein
MKRFSLLDTINLRTSSVYNNPRDISVLKIIVGDFSDTDVPCTAIDKSGTIFHASDFPMQTISRVSVEGKPADSGYTAYPARQDETGRSIACVVFSEPQYQKAVTISGKGAIKLTDGALIENAADLTRFVLEYVQEYDDAVNEQELSVLYTQCLKEDMKVAYILDDNIRQLKSFFDELALNIHAHTLLSHGKSIVRLKYGSLDNPIRYHFNEQDIEDFKMTSEELINEITVNYAYDHSLRKCRSSITKENPLSKIIYGVTRKNIDLKMIQKTRQAEKIADEMLRTYSIPQIICSFKHNLRSVYVEPGDRISISHAAGIGSSGFVEATGIVTARTIDNISISYTVAMDWVSSLYTSILVSLTQTAGAGKLGIRFQYRNGTLIISVYFDIQGYPPVMGAKITINDKPKTTGVSGDVTFELSNGTYRAIVEASGYDKQEIIFTT